MIHIFCYTIRYAIAMPVYYQTLVFTDKEGFTPPLTKLYEFN